LKQWKQSLFARIFHPREEHFMPFLVAAGAGGDGQVKRIFTDEPMGVTISAYRFDD
jgi:4,5-DOPA dioxygenase extradiol